MADTPSEILQTRPEYVSTSTFSQRLPVWQHLALGAIMLISVFMNFFQLGQNGFGTFFYVSGVRSMLDSWHNFFFVSFDPGGFVTIDKPPLGFWLEVISAKIFGFTPFSVFLPQVLANVLSVLVLYYLVRHHFGVAAALLAALALAVSPISIVTARYHTIDSTLALALLIGAWAVLRAAETGRLRWLLLSALMVGLGFNIKMLEAYLVVPAFGLLYLLAAPRSMWTRLGHLLLAAALLLAVSLSWALAVDMTPPSQRPYVGSSQDNSEISLAFGYNGLERLLGRTTPGRGGNVAATTTPPGNRGASAATKNSGNTGQGQQRPGRGGGFGDNNNPGPLRLFMQPLGGQIAWLLPLALLGLLATGWQRRFRPRDDQQQKSLLLWGTWLLTMGSFFSVANFFQAYYMTEMAPAICALFGIGLVVMWQDLQRPGWRGWLLPLALAVTAAEQVYLLSAYPLWGSWLIPLIIVMCTIAVIALIGVRVAPQFHTRLLHKRFFLPLLGASVLALLLTPTVWAAIPVLQNTTAFTPTAGPTQSDDIGRNFGGGDNAVDPLLLHYLVTNQGHTKFLLATINSMSADAFILATNKPVMAMGGFAGNDPILTTNQLTQLISNGTVRFFLLNTPRTRQQLLARVPARYRGFVAGWLGNQQAPLTTWVTKHCLKVPAYLWQSVSTKSTSTSANRGQQYQLYDCATLH